MSRYLLLATDEASQVQKLHAMTTPSGRAEEHDDLVDRIPAFVLVFDANDRIVDYNQRLESTTGFSRDEMIGKDARALVGNGGDRRLDLKGGGHRLVRWQCHEEPGPTGLGYALGIDVTEERTELRRTLQSERLAAAGTLAAGLAHEVRNPLNSATLQLQVLRRRIERGQLEREQLLPVVDIVDGEINRLERLVHDFLAFAQPHRVELASTLLNELLRDVVASLANDPGCPTVTFAYALDGDIGAVDVEPTSMKRALGQLIENAIEAMPNGGTVTLRTVAADARGFVSVEIEDTGSGFPDGAPIFDAFYSTKPGRSGLGLAIAHKIVSEHGGVLKGESGKSGARFSLLLPQLRKESP